MAIMRIKNDNGEWEEIDALIGPPGPSNNLSIGSVSKGENASASITGDSPNQVLNLVLPKGDPGPQGDVGPKGDPGLKPIKGEDYFTSDDIEELNISGIEKYILLSDMSSSAPEITAQNSKYYNTSNKLIYTSIDESHWSDFSEEPKRNVFYINTKNGSMYYWNGTDMVLVMPADSLYLGTCTDMNECLINQNGDIVDPIIPHLESSWLVASISNKQNIWNSTNIQINVDAEEKVGKYFELDTVEHVIKILHTCEALVSASAFFDGTEGDSYAWLKISKNNNVVASKLERIINRDFPHATIAAKPISLTKGDSLKLVLEYGGSTGNPSIRASKDVTFLSVTKI